MSEHTNPSYRDEDYEGYAAAGRPAGVPVTPLSDEDVRMLEAAWNNPRAYELSKDEGFVSAGYVPPPVDPNRPLVPPEEEIKKLPRWAQVAFAARCARRVLPLTVKECERDVPPGHLRLLEKAVRLAERSAGTAATAAYERLGLGFGGAVQFASDAAERAATATQDFVPCLVARTVEDAVQQLCRVVTVRALSDLITPARDFECIRWRAAVEKWTDDSPVSQAVFGPMWEGTPPAWWTDDILAGLPPEPPAPPVGPGPPIKQPNPAPAAAPTSP